MCCGRDDEGGAGAADQRPLPVQGGGQVPAGRQRQPLLAHGERHLPQHGEDVPGVGGRGGPPAHHQHAAGRGCGPGEL